MLGIRRRWALIAPLLLGVAIAPAQEGVTVFPVSDLPTQSALSRWLPAGTALRVAVPVATRWNDRPAVPIAARGANEDVLDPIPAALSPPAGVPNGEPQPAAGRARGPGEIARALLGSASDREGLLDAEWRDYLEGIAADLSTLGQEATVVYLVGTMPVQPAARPRSPLEAAPGDRIELLAVTGANEGTHVAVYLEADTVVDLELVPVAWTTDGADTPVPSLVP